METKRKRKRKSEIDRISKLPEFIIHEILSYLNAKDAARTSALSKTWLQSYSTSPVLTFNERNFFHNSPQIKEENRYPFFNFVKNTLIRYSNLNLRIQKFEINIFRVLDHTPAYRLLDESLGMVIGNGVKELDISVITRRKFSAAYTLSPTIFESPKMLTYFRVHQCKFPQNVAATSKCNALVFPFLKTLDLNLAYIDDGMLQKLLSSSPSLEKIVFFRVSGFKKLQVSNLSKLKVIDIKSSSTASEIDIEDAPSLCLVKCERYLKSPCLLKVGSAPNLRHLELFSVSIGEKALNELVTKSSFLEDLKIYHCHGLKRIDIVSASLKRLRFGGCKKLVEVKINAPCLLALHYNGENMLSLSLNNTPEGLKTHISITNYGLDQLNNAWFHKLGKLLKGVANLVSFSLFQPNQGIEFGTFYDFRANPLPPEHQAENFMPEINQSSSLFGAFVETLFSSSRPTLIYCIIFLKPLFADFIKFLISELIKATGNSNCCSSNQTKCWRHYLKDIKLEFYEDSQKGWQSLPQETSLSEFTFCGKKIRLNLKWYANLNAHV